jgi:transketolase
MEGISAEASSLAGHLGLGRLIYFYDHNKISIDGSTDITFTEDVRKRFEAVGWHVEEIDGHDLGAIGDAARACLAVEDRPSLVIARTHIAQGAPNAHDTPKAHGSPLGADEIRLAKEAMGFDPEVSFFVPDGVYDAMRSAMDKGRNARNEWTGRAAARADDWNAFFGEAAVSLESPGFEGPIATRAASGKLFAQMAEKVPGFIGGAADLVESTKTAIDHSRLFTRDDHAARDIAYGIREHAMGAITNGMAVHGGLKPYGATFFMFSDYMRPAVRLSALMGAPSVWVWTHDSVFLGEDGPTHQPIEHLATLRALPNLWVVRPADATETLEAWELALNRNDGPVALVLSRQNLPVLERPRGGLAKGGYVLRAGTDVVLVATGSEVSLAMDAAGLLAEGGVSARVVSMPCWELFFEQDDAYRASVLGEGVPRVSIEAGSTFGWERIVGSDGLMIGIDRFGASAPASVIAEHLGFTPQQVADRVRTLF